MTVSRLVSVVICSGEVVTLSSIEMVHKKRRHDKESRLQTVMVGAADV